MQQSEKDKKWFYIVTKIEIEMKYYNEMLNNPGKVCDVKNIIQILK